MKNTLYGKIVEGSRINQIKFGREFRKSNLLILNAKEIKLKNRKEMGTSFTKLNPSGKLGI